jgi:hypothetical protein
MSACPPTLATLDRHLSPDEVEQALAAVCDLLIPAPDLNLVNRDDLGALLRVLCVLRGALASV